MISETERELLQQKLLAYIAINLSGENKELRNELGEIWNRIVGLTYGEDAVMVKPLTEQIMREEYEAIRKLSPKFKINRKSNQISIEGLT